MQKRVIGVILAVAMLLTMTPVTGLYEKVYAANEGTGILRIFSTTDLHGQSVRYNYDTASDHVGSLAQISTVINRNKNMRNGASLIVDSGDTVYGNGAKAIADGEVSGIQYMFKAMKTVGYDAITLGNHDFDFGYDYIKEALEESGMNEKTVLANVVEAKSGTPKAWSKSRIIQKTLTTTTGARKTVNIGITGAVIPALSTHTAWKGILTTTDIVESVEAEAAKLKAAGADVIVVLAHTGIGTGEYEYMGANLAYQLCFIDDVDVVCSGHTHKDFPGDDPYVEGTYDLPGVSASGLVNGKVLIQESDHGESLGITDLTLGFAGGRVQVLSRSAKVRRIKDSDAEDPNVVEANRRYDTAFKKLFSAKLATVESTEDNFLGFLEDNALVQTANEAKISHVKTLLQEKAPEYAGYPVIAAVFYSHSGNSLDDYVYVDESIQLKDILNIQKNSQIKEKTYYITGAQLKEMLEFNPASAYQVPANAKKAKWSDENLKEIVTEQDLTPVLSNAWQNWNNFAVFDGIEYVIDPTVLPRYDCDGFLINDTRRVKKLTCNGKDVTDNQIFVLASSQAEMKEELLGPVYEQVSKQQIISKSDYLGDIIKEYIEQHTVNGVFEVKADNNWRVDFPEGSSYVVKAVEESYDCIPEKSIYEDRILETNGFTYYKLKLGGEYEDISGPLVVVTSLNSEVSGDPIWLDVQSSDASKVSDIKYATDIEAAYGAWKNGNVNNLSKIKIDRNGTYAIKATDSKGNITIKHINVDNIDGSVSTAPKVNALSNRSKTVKGQASPNAAVTIKTRNGEYETKADNSGDFSCKVSMLEADEVVKVSQTDKQGRVSPARRITVKRKGANHPTIDSLTNKDTEIWGVLNDSSYCRVLAIRGSNVYIPRGETSNYKKTKIYEKNKGKNVREVDYTYDKDNGTFSLAVPSLYANQKIKVYAYDWIQRISTVEKVTVEDVAPNKPKVAQVMAREGVVYGSIPNPKDNVTYTVRVYCEDEVYKGTANPDGSYVIETDYFAPGSNVAVRISDTAENGEERNSLTTRLKTIGFDEPGRAEFVNGHIDELNSKDTVITGYVNDMPDRGLYLLYGLASHEVTLNENGEFEYELPEPRRAGTKVCLLSRDSDGSLQTYRYINVALAKPDEPWILTEDITEDTVKIKIRATELADGYVMIGDKKYKHSAVVEKGDDYVYVFKNLELKRKKEIYIWLRNEAGASRKIYCGKVKKGEPKPEEQEGSETTEIA
ncbi:MAG: metallophosphoesterase [Lachnospiraceae bacterium]|nr:metallophosphoesterase [Lachnospiraceae bacterium]